MTICPSYRLTFVDALGISHGQKLGSFSDLMVARFLKPICSMLLMSWCRWRIIGSCPLWLIDNTSHFVWCQFWIGFLKQMCGTFCISLVWRVWRDCSCGISKLWYLQDCGLDKLQLELALSCNEKYIYVYIWWRPQKFEVFLQSNHGSCCGCCCSLYNVFAWTRRVFCYSITSLGSMLNKGFCISWTHFSDQCPALKDALASSDSTWMVVFLGKFARTANFIMKVRMKIVILGKFTWTANLYHESEDEDCHPW